MSPDAEVKWQPLIVKGKNAPIINCTVKMKLDGKEVVHLWWPYPETKLEPDKITFMEARRNIDINPDDEVQLLVWKGLKTKERQRVYLLTDTTVPIELGPDLDKLKIDIWFTSKDGQLNKKPFRYEIHSNSWDDLELSET